MIAGLKRVLRPRAQQTIDKIVGPLYVREEHLRSVVAELERMLGNGFDAQAEVNAILGRQLAALTEAVGALQEEMRALRIAVDRAGGDGADDARRAPADASRSRPASS